jgi:hypothetical protein
MEREELEYGKATEPISRQLLSPLKIFYTNLLVFQRCHSWR